MALYSVKTRTARSEVVSNPEILGGTPCVDGTRVPAETIALYLQAGATRQTIFNDYPSLPLDGVEAVERWLAAAGPEARRG